MDLLDDRVKAIFDDALEIDSPGERAAYLDRACADVPELRQKVEQLLKAFSDAGGFLKLGPEEQDFFTTTASPPGFAPAKADPD
jgi:hypothetical protein